jgi:hypothetical protein
MWLGVSSTVCAGGSDAALLAVGVVEVANPRRLVAEDAAGRVGAGTETCLGGGVGVSAGCNKIACVTGVRVPAVGHWTENPDCGVCPCVDGAPRRPACILVDALGVLSALELALELEVIRISSGSSAISSGV